MSKLDAKGVQNAIKFGMSREAIADKYEIQVKQVEEEIKHIYPHNWVDMLKKIDKNKDKRKSAKNMKANASIKEKMKEAEEVDKTAKKPASKVEKTELEKLQEQAENHKKLIYELIDELEACDESMNLQIEAQHETSAKIEKLRKELEEDCKKFTKIGEEIERIERKISICQSKLEGEKRKLEKVEEEIYQKTKIVIRVNVANEICSKEKLDYDGFQAIFINLLQSSELSKMSVGEVEALTKVIAAVQKIGKEKVEVKFESKALAELYEKFA